MPRKPGASVRVRGTCGEGHVTEATSAPGRVTWEGQCSHEGCDLPVKARRMPGRAAAPPADSGPPRSSAGGAPPETPPARPAGRLKRVRYDVQPDPEPRRDDAAGGGDAGGAGPTAAAPRPAGGAPRQQPVRGRGRPEPDVGGAPTGGPGRLRDRIAARRAQRAERGRSGARFVGPFEEF